MPNVGPMEIVIVLIIALIVVGPKRLPDLSRSLGQGIREFKDSMTLENKDRFLEEKERYQKEREDNVKSPEKAKIIE